MDPERTETEYIIEQFGKNGLTIGEEKAQQLCRYFSMIVEKNKVMNLTTITEFRDVVDKHFIDSSILLKYVNLEDKSVIDVGTGAGFPGIPLKILCPGIRLTLLDSLRKRIDFLNEVIAELNMDGVETIHARAEELANKSEYREKFDAAVSRAVSNLSTLSEYCLPFVRVDGDFYSYKGQKARQEVDEAKKAITVLGGKIINEFNINLVDTDYDRTIIDIHKISETPKKYPRSGNKPSSNPIK